MAEPSDDPAIHGDIPLRNAHFVGRESLLLSLQWSLRTRAKVAVLSQATCRYGGVGTTELAAEYAYRFAGRYDLVWWIRAEQQSMVLRSLADLGRRLGTPVTQDLTRTSTAVLDALNTGALRWLLVYDHAGEPDELVHLIPSTGGHVILTSRNQEWAGVWDVVEVDVFERPESIALIRRRAAGIPYAEADRLADRLGDLPLAVDQAASWHAATGMPTDAYLERLDQGRHDPAAGEPADCPAAVAATVDVAFRELLRSSPAAAQLLGMLAVLGPERISTDLLRRGHDSGIPGPLGPVLGDPPALHRALDALDRFGLSRSDGRGGVQVPRLFQSAVRVALGAATRRSRAAAHRLLGAANAGLRHGDAPGPLHAEINEHVVPAGLIAADGRADRRAVLDQIRYLWAIGDHEGSRRLGDAAVNTWRDRTDQPDLGPDGESTLLASRHLAVALLSLGMEDRAGTLAEDVLERIRASPVLGPDHQHAFSAADVVVHCHRVAGRYDRAHELDLDLAGRCRRIVGDGDAEWLRRLASLARDRRLLGGFQGAYVLDAKVVDSLAATVADRHPDLLAARSDLASDLHGLGRYAESLALQEQVLEAYRRILPDPQHPRILLATHALAIALRRAGRYAEALPAARAAYADCMARYGDSHQYSLATTLTYANTLRVAGGSEVARDMALRATIGYRRVLGWGHPLTQVAMVDTAAILRGAGDVSEARRLDEDAHRALTAALGPLHDYTLCAASGVANDVALSEDPGAARALSAEILAVSTRCRGETHPYTLLCAVNAAEDEPARRQAVEALALALGADHPEVVAVRNGARAECDIEPRPADLHTEM